MVDMSGIIMAIADKEIASEVLLLPPKDWRTMEMEKVGSIH